MNYDLPTDNPLVNYILEKNWDKAQSLIDHGAFDSLTGFTKKKLLLEVAKSYESDLEHFKFLKSLGIPLTSADSKDFSLLHHVTRTNKLDILKFLLSEGFNPMSLTPTKMTLLHSAAEGSAFETLDFLLDLKNFFSPDVRDEDGRDVLYTLLESRRRCYPGPLETHIKNSYIDATKKLLTKGCFLKSQTITLKTPLHAAASSALQDVAQILISGGAHINAQDLFGNTPLHLAAKTAREETPELVDFLMSKGANHHLQNYSGETPFDDFSYDTSGMEADPLLEEQLDSFKDKYPHREKRIPFKETKAMHDYISKNKPKPKPKPAESEYQTCPDCCGTGTSDSYIDDDGDPSCPYCGGMGKWKKPRL